MIVKYTDYQGKERKPLIQAIDTITNTKGQYSMSPKQYCYIWSDDIILEKDGTLTATKEIVELLGGMDFECAVIEDEIIVEVPETADTDTITIEIPKQGSLSDEKLQNLLKLAESKHTLITKALGRPLIIQDGGENVQFVFPFSEEVGIAQIYSQLAYAMVRYVKKHQRVTAVEKEVESEKFALRAWMVKLGMNGGEYSAARKWYCRNLSGNASFSSNAKYTEMQDSRRKGGADDEQD